MKFYYCILLILILSCTSQNNKKNIAESPNFGYENLLIKDSTTGYYMYQWNRKFLSDDFDTKPKYSFLINSSGDSIADLNISSIKNMGTFLVEENYIFFIYERAGEIELITKKRNEVKGTCLFTNSQYRIEKGKLNYYGSGCLGDSEFIDCKIKITGLRLSENDIKVLHVDKNYNDFVLYKKKLFRNGYYVKKLHPNQESEVNKAIKEKSFEERICF